MHAHSQKKKQTQRHFSTHLQYLTTCEVVENMDDQISPPAFSSPDAGAYSLFLYQSLDRSKLPIAYDPSYASTALTTKKNKKTVSKFSSLYCFPVEVGKGNHNSRDEKASSHPPNRARGSMGRNIKILLLKTRRSSLPKISDPDPMDDR